MATRFFCKLLILPIGYTFKTLNRNTDVCVDLCSCVFVRVHLYMRVRACEYSRAFVFVCVCVCALCVRVCPCVCALLPHRCCSGVHDAVLEQPLLKQA